MKIEEMDEQEVRDALYHAICAECAEALADEDVVVDPVMGTPLHSRCYRDE